MSVSGSDDRPLGQPRVAGAGRGADERGVHGERPDLLSEAETEALAGWIPGNATVVAVLRGRPALDTSPIWVATAQGVLVASMAEGTRGHLRARTDWVPVDVIRRVVGIRNGAAVSVLLQARTRLFTLLSDDDASASLFVETTRSLLAGSGRRRRARPTPAPRRPPRHGEAA